MSFSRKIVNHGISHSNNFYSEANAYIMFISMLHSNNVSVFTRSTRRIRIVHFWRDSVAIIKILRIKCEFSPRITALIIISIQCKISGILVFAAFINNRFHRRFARGPWFAPVLCWVLFVKALKSDTIHVHTHIHPHTAQQAMVS